MRLPGEIDQVVARRRWVPHACDQLSENRLKRSRVGFGGVRTSGTLAPSLVTVLPVRSPSARRWPVTPCAAPAPPNVRDALLFPATVPSVV